jgi:spermidine synthase
LHMELWYSEHHTEHVKLSLKVKEQLYGSQSDFQHIAILDTVEFGRALTLDGYLMVTEKDEFIYHDMIVHVPMATNPEIKRVLVIGAGDGGTIRELTRYQGIESIDMVEIDEMVVRVCKKYLPQTACSLEDPRVHIYYEDGLKFVRRQLNEYDLILVDSTDPFGPGEGLFTKEFYGNCYQALTDQGILVNQHESTYYHSYVVMQSGKEDPEYYLYRDLEGKNLKAGSLFLDSRSSLEEHSRNLTIHGHNMTSTDNMFHYLVKFKELDYYKERPVFTFDSIYDTAKWKVFAIFITNGTSAKEELFDYTRADFKDTSDFLNFVYQLRIRSIYNIDSVDINETDQLLTLSTCSYEVKNYRTVIVARKVREGEDAAVDVEKAGLNPKPLYPYSYYYRYGGQAPKLTDTFEEAYSKGEINWYNPDPFQTTD